MDKRRNRVARHFLTPEEDSWIDTFRLPRLLRPNNDEMELLWSMKPTTKEKIFVYDRYVEIPRWQSEYLEPFPSILQKYIDYANSSEYIKPYNAKFNSIRINWYDNGHQYIGYHADIAERLLETKDKESVIFSISFGETRDFGLKPKINTDTYTTLKLSLSDNTVIVMGGKCQHTHKHSLIKASGQKGLNMKGRINLTFRMYQDN